MSPLALHEDEETHVPPWQLVEQHCRPPAHASPSILHVKFVPLDPRGWHVVLQVPEQQSPPAVHEAPSTAHGLELHFPSVPHSPVQHSVGLVHASPAFLPQKSSVVHWPPLHLPEQQSPLELHATPLPPQLQTWVLVSQLPEQQSELRLQPLWFGVMQTGLMQVLFAQDLLQQSASALQNASSVLQVVHCPLSQVSGLQHSDALAQLPEALHVLSQ